MLNIYLRFIYLVYKGILVLLSESQLTKRIIFVRGDGVMKK